jgi:hypothetical protein
MSEVREHGSHTAQEASFEVFLSSSSISNNILASKSLTLHLPNGLETRESEVGQSTERHMSNPLCHLLD